MLSDLCIRRPILATVMSILIVLGGVIAASILPISQYPEITPPTVTISTSYEGANAQTIARTVAAPIEDQLSGVEGLLYYTTSIRANGDVRIQCVFDVGADANNAMLEINNRVRSAERRLPNTVRQNGVNVRKRSEEVLLMVAFTSPDGSKAPTDLADYALLNIVDPLKRIPGVGDVSVFGNVASAMRIWMDPQRMAQLGITPQDIQQAIEDKNTEHSSGPVGAAPLANNNQALYYTTMTRGQRLAPEEFGDIVVKTNTDGSLIRIRDVATTEVGKRSYEMLHVFNGKPGITLAVYLQTGANSLATAEAVKAALDQFAQDYPEGQITHEITDDTSIFVEASLQEVLKTLMEAGVLVLVVVFLFLQNWRSTLIPMVAVPVSLIGTMAGLWLLDFSLNTMTLFAMTLAIGIVVDDAIVVLENVERLMREGRSPKEAAFEAMREVSGALVAIVLVLSAVFIPVAFLGGIAGELYRQFAVTLSVSVVLSGFVALTLTPALCAIFLKIDHHKKPGRFFNTFNRGLSSLTNSYLQLVKWALHYRWASAIVLIATTFFCWTVYHNTPTSFIPNEDQGIVRVAISLPDGASFNRMEEESNKLRQRIEKEIPGIRSILLMQGMDNQSSEVRPNVASMIIRLDHWDNRELTAFQIRQMAQKIMSQSDASISVASMPAAIRGLGSSNGFTGYIQSRGSDDVQALQRVTEDFMTALSADPRLTSLRSFLRAQSPMLNLVLDEDKASQLGVSADTVFSTISSFFSGTYINDFTRNGRTYRVIMQAQADARMKPEDLQRIWVRSDSGQMVMLGSILSLERVSGADSLARMNGYMASQFMGAAAQGTSSGDALNIVEEIADTVLPDGYVIEWTGQAWHEKRIGASANTAFIYGMIIVFLILAALYERWSLPIAVVLAIPFGLLGALCAVWLRGSSNDIYFQIGVLVLIGLTAKNAILIVEFAVMKLQEGMNVYDAAIEAARLRLRPILMTSMAFVLGVVPLVFATGPGAAARHSMGTGVFGGMLTATFVATIFVPVFFTWFVKQAKAKDGKRPEHKPQYLIGAKPSQKSAEQKSS